MTNKALGQEMRLPFCTIRLVYVSVTTNHEPSRSILRHNGSHVTSDASARAALHRCQLSAANVRAQRLFTLVLNMLPPYTNYRTCP